VIVEYLKDYSRNYV